MKRLILLSAFCIMVVSNSLAQYVPSILNLRMYNNSSFTYNLDGVMYNTNSSTQRLDNLQAGAHFINVYVAQWMYGGGYSQRLVYSGNINISPSTESFVTIYADRLSVDRVISLQAPNYQPTWNDPYAYNPHEGGYYGRSHHGHGQCGTPPAPPVCNMPRPMNDMEFSNFLNTIRNASFESTKLSIANTVVRSNNFTTQQVKAILQQFSFESTKLDFAKTAYYKTIDKNNYYLINDVFAFSSSTIALNDFIASR